MKIIVGSLGRLDKPYPCEVLNSGLDSKDTLSLLLSLLLLICLLKLSLDSQSIKFLGYSTWNSSCFQLGNSNPSSWVYYFNMYAVRYIINAYQLSKIIHLLRAWLHLTERCPEKVYTQNMVSWLNSHLSLQCRSCHHSGKGTEVPVQPPSRGCSPAAAKAG
jgi:hypothetical protein